MKLPTTLALATTVFLSGCASVKQGARRATLPVRALAAHATANLTDMANPRLVHGTDNELWAAFVDPDVRVHSLQTRYRLDGDEMIEVGQALNYYERTRFGIGLGSCYLTRQTATRLETGNWADDGQQYHVHTVFNPNR